MVAAKEKVNDNFRNLRFTQGRFAAALFAPVSRFLTLQMRQRSRYLSLSVVAGLSSDQGDSGAWVLNGKDHLGCMIMGGHFKNP